MLRDTILKARSYRSFDSSVKIDEATLIEFIDDARISSATMNIQPLKYRIVNGGEELSAILSLSRFASSLGIKLPPEGHEPTAFIVICHDDGVTPFKPIFLKDVGICAEVIMLSAAEKGFGGCMIGSANPDAVSEALSLPENLTPQLLIALGKPDETVVLEDSADGEVKYYRDENNVHHVPKRRLEDVIVK
ncbi:MAG: nitroreductase family protein [Clostridia bacterium]|nr:nitroreductase family protein [Clostridia bacterium]